MDKQKFRDMMLLKGETREDVANILGITLYGLTRKINNSRGSQFNAVEINFLKEHWHLSGEEVCEIFFNNTSSKKCL